MNALVALGITSFVLCLVLTPVCRDIFLRFGLVDKPDDRKIHKEKIPRIGGIPIALSYVGALGLMLAFAPANARIAVQHRTLLYSLLPAVGLVFLTGLIDDLITLKPWQKLAGQVAAAVWAVTAGARIPLLEGQHPSMVYITIPLSVIWLVGCTNAFNLIDGLDGLAPGVGLFATITTLLAALIQGNWGLAMATVPLAGCLLGFLRYNFNPASIYLGDSGSLSIGFILGCFGVIWSQKSATLLGMLAPAMALALPLLDVGLSIGRRFLRSQPIFQPDRGHIHHRLLAMGFEPKRAALVLYLACGVAAVLSLVQSSFAYNLGGLVILLFCFGAWLFIKKLGYIEFKTAKRVLSRSGVLRMVQHELLLNHLRESFRLAETRGEYWMILRTACQDLQFSSVELNLGSESFYDVLDPESLESSWEFRLDFEEIGSICLRRSMQNSSQSLVNDFFQILQNSIAEKDFGYDSALTARNPLSTLGGGSVVRTFPSGGNLRTRPLAAVSSRRTSNG